MTDQHVFIPDEEESGHIENTVDDAAVWKATAVLTIASLVLNLVIYFIGLQADWIPDEMPDSTKAFSLVTVILASAIPVVLFGMLMVWLGNNAPRAARLFTMILLVVAIIAIMVPFTLQGIDDSFQYVLLAMHIVTTGCIFLLTRLSDN